MRLCVSVYHLYVYLTLFFEGVKISVTDEEAAQESSGNIGLSFECFNLLLLCSLVISRVSFNLWLQVERDVFPDNVVTLLKITRPAMSQIQHSYLVESFLSSVVEVLPRLLSSHTLPICR